jgi:Holliday junction resolvase RusA-like endonuclease
LSELNALEDWGGLWRMQIKLEDKIKNMSERTTYYQNPDFEEVLIFFDEEVFTSSEKYKPVEGGLYERRDKGNAVDFINNIKEKLSKEKKNNWPYTQKIMLVIGISGTKGLYGNRDIDNMVKSVFDALKGVLFVDDSQIHLLIASKQIWNKNMKGFMVGLRVLDENKIDKYEPWLFTPNPSPEQLREIEKKFGKKAD